MRLPFESSAATELEEAATWYERERHGYGALFVAEVRRTVERAAEFPESGARLPGTKATRDVRRFLVRRFPYSVVTAVMNEQRAVVAIAHHSRRPGYWNERVK